MTILVVVGLALMAILLVIVLLAMLPDELVALVVFATVGLVLLYGLVRFVKWAWQG